jgi:uncharacterized protein (DUF983 family)
MSQSHEPTPSADSGIAPAASGFAPADPDAIRALPAMRRGFLGHCPACNKGRLFGRFLKVADRCEVCGTEFHHHRADDLPPYLVIFVVGHLIGYGILMTETRLEVPMWAHLALWPALALVLCLALLQPMKGAVVGLQYALGMHGFGAARAQKTTEEENQRDGRSGTQPDGSTRFRGA